MPKPVVRKVVYGKHARCGKLTRADLVQRGGLWREWVFFQHEKPAAVKEVTNCRRCAHRLQHETLAIRIGLTPEEVTHARRAA